MSLSGNLLGGPPPTYLPDDAPVREALAAGADPAAVAAASPSSSLPWSLLADAAFADGQVIASYAYARTGYHRGLDALRRNGWKGFGPVPWSHVPNQGFLRAVNALGRAAESIGETEEAARCATLLDDCDPSAAAALAL